MSANLIGGGQVGRWLAIGLLGLLFWSTMMEGAESGKVSKPEVRKDVVAAIEGQLTAFRAGDTKQAYTFAAAALRAQTPLRQFARIVETNYPEIWANTRGEFGLVRDDGTRATVLVKVFS